VILIRYTISTTKEEIMTSLMQKLLDLNFLPVAGVQETDGSGNPAMIPHGAPHRWDENNGVLAIYDDRGVPWVIAAEKIPAATRRQIVTDWRLQSGAYVPFSNDGGAFVTGAVLSPNAAS